MPNFLSKIGTRVWDVLNKDVTAVWTPFYGADASSRVTKANLMDNDKNWVYVCTDKIADSVAGVQLKLMRYSNKGEDVEVFDHPALNLLNKPNPYQSGRNFKYSTISHEELTGNAYWLKDVAQNPKVLIPLNPKYVTPVISKDGTTIERYKYREGQISKDIPVELIYHLRYPNPGSFLLGRGTVEPIAEWVDVDNYATEFNRKFFINGASFGGFIESEASTKQAQELIRIGVENMHKGVRNAHKIGILPKGAKFNESKMTPKDMEFSEADNRFRDKILAAFGVPKSVVGIVEDVNRANAESSNYVFMAFTVKPKLDRLIDFLNEFYLPEFGATTNLYFTYVDPTPENQQILLEENKAAGAGAAWETVNEIRAKKGKEPVAGGDVILVPFNLTPIDSMGANPADPNAPYSATNPPPSKSKAPKGNFERAKIVDGVAGKVFDMLKVKETRDELTARHKEFVVRVTTYEAKLMADIKKHDMAQKNKVIENVKKIVTKSAKTKAVTKADLFNLDTEVGAMIDFATPLLNDLLDDEGTRAMIMLGLQDIFNPTYERIQKILNASIARMAKSYSQTTLDLLASKINEGLDAGEGIAKITDRISGVYDLTEEYRAERTARTEVYSVANDASREAYQQSDVVKTIKWVAEQGCCEFCDAMEKEGPVAVSESFANKGDTVEGTDGGTYDLSYEKLNNPPMHPNCRCFIQPDEISVKSVKKPEHKHVHEEDISEADFWAGLEKLLKNENA